MNKDDLYLVALAFHKVTNGNDSEAFAAAVVDVYEQEKEAASDSIKNETDKQAKGRRS